MSKPRKINGYQVTINHVIYRPSDGSMGDYTGESHLRHEQNREPEAREAYSASIGNTFYHEKTLGPFDSEKEAEAAARKWTAEAKKHRLFR